MNKKLWLIIIATAVCLVLVGVVSVTVYLAFRYSSSSRSQDYTTKERVAANHEMAELLRERTNDWDDQTVVCIVDSAYRGLFESETDYTVSVYILDEEAFAAGQAADSNYNMDTLWAYSEDGPKNDKFKSLVKAGTVTVVKNEKTGEILSFSLEAIM